MPFFCKLSDNPQGVYYAIISYFVFGEIIDIWVIIGSLVILCGVIIVIPKRQSKSQVHAKLL
ncbi:MAG: hypothetical protein EBS06_03825 [Proteobacteria bacterium]|nr:hypothetical protein [Pseudomonadota bacterium]